MTRLMHARRAARILAICLALASVRGAAGEEFELRGYKLRVPNGFSVEVVAEQPLVKYPVCADFDEAGRLYVCETSGTVDWNQPQKADSMHRVLRLEDVDGDGRYDRRTVYAEFEMMAQGSMWLDGSLYVAAAPILWKLTDADDDGVAETREKWIEQREVTGCLNDIRGPYLGPDGYIYWCKGPAPQEYVIDGRPWRSAARHIMRRHPNGGDAEQLMVGGMDNPIEIAFSADGERFLTCTNFHMLSEPRDDGILHAVYGGMYPKDIAPVFEFPWTGPDMLRPMTSWGALSPAGLACYVSEFFGSEYRGDLFSALFSGHKVLRHQLSPLGSTYAATNEEFLACDNVEFHPTDVLEDADGSLLVIETGGWYLHCCPSSTFYRPDVEGAIYRVRRADAPAVVDPRGAKIAFDTLDSAGLAKLLADARPAVRRRAVDRLVAGGKKSLPALRQVLNGAAATTPRLEALWACARIDHKAARDAVRQRLRDADDSLRHAALAAVSFHRDALAIDTLAEIARDGSPADRRLAAEALGRMRDAKCVEPLLAALAAPVDRTLEHAIIFALIETADPAATRAALSSELSHVRRGAMIALDQMPGGQVEPREVLAEFDSADPRMRDAAWWIVSRHAQDWGGLMADRLRRSLADETATEADRAELRTRLARLVRSPELSKWIVAELAASGVSASTRMLLVQSMGDAGGQFADPKWIEALLSMVSERGRDPALAAEAIAAIGKLPAIRSSDDPGGAIGGRLRRDLLASAADESLGAAARLRAVTALKGSPRAIDDELFAFLLLQLAPEQPYELRASAAEAIAGAKLTDSQLSRLARGLKNVAAAELNTVLAAFQGCQDSEVGERLASSLLGSSAAANLNAFRLQTLFGGFDETVQARAEPLFERLRQAQAKQLARADHVAELAAHGDAIRGLQVFDSQKAACTSCHKARNVGGVTGPHLRGVGTRRTERDLIESILFPSASIVQSFETWSVATTDGRVLTGVLVEDRPDEIVLSAGLDKTYRLPRSAIDQMTRAEQSTMPSGLDELLSDEQLADLVAFLKSL